MLWDLGGQAEELCTKALAELRGELHQKGREGPCVLRKGNGQEGEPLSGKQTAQ